MGVEVVFLLSIFMVNIPLLVLLDAVNSEALPLNHHVRLICENNILLCENGQYKIRNFQRLLFLKKKKKTLGLISCSDLFRQNNLGP